MEKWASLAQGHYRCPTFQPTQEYSILICLQFLAFFVEQFDFSMTYVIFYNYVIILFNFSNNQSLIDQVFTVICTSILKPQQNHFDFYYFKILFLYHKMNATLNTYFVSQIMMHILYRILIYFCIIKLHINPLLQMLKPKQNIPSNLPIKSKSPYARQFEEFEKRLEKNRGITKFPTIPLKSRKVSLQENLRLEEQYMELAKRLIHNKEKIKFCEEKENLFDVDQKHTEELTCMKSKIVQLKKRFSHQSQPQNTQISENLSQYCPPMSAPKGLREPILNNRSRALSNIPNVLNERELNDGANFLLYKKGKRDLSSRSKNE